MKKPFTRNAELAAYLDRLSNADRKIASIKIRDACMIPYHKYSNWVHGLQTIEPLYCVTIEKALGCKIFNID